MTMGYSLLSVTVQKQINGADKSKQPREGDGTGEVSGDLSTNL